MNDLRLDARLDAPAATRNRDAILDVLRHHLPPEGFVLEIASGSGQHCVHFAASLPGLTFQPSDPDARARASIDAWAREAGAANIRSAVALDAATPTWAVERADAVLCINMVHISPWGATIGLMEGAARVLAAGGPLILYGPYKRGGLHTAPSNAAFDEDLRRRNSAWGVRDLDDVAALAAKAGFTAPIVVEMPANNLSLVFARL